jgi:hypothetical protein
MHEVAHGVHTEDTDQSRDQQYKRNLEKHLASRPQPIVPRGESTAAQLSVVAARGPAPWVRDVMVASARLGRDKIGVSSWVVCAGSPVTATGATSPRTMKSRCADDPLNESANPHPPGLATTTRMAARPSSCLQRNSRRTLRLSLTAASIRAPFRVLVTGGSVSHHR